MITPTECSWVYTITPGKAYEYCPHPAVGVWNGVALCENHMPGDDDEQ